MSRSALVEVAAVFFRLGATAFGGPAAHIAMMEEELVRRRGWISRERFVDLLGAANLIPGPTSTELAIHIGHARAGWPGLVVAGVSFIVPAMLIVLGLAWLYVRHGSLPELGGVLRGVKPVVIAVVAQALWSLSRTAVKTPFLGAVGAAAAAGALLGAPELAVLAAAGVVAMGARGVGLRAVAVAAAPATTAAFSLPALFLTFLKIGSILFGSGYVLLAFLRADLVERLGWLTEAQLLDAVAVGQITPGPVFTTATFIGYLVGGTPGALVATAGIFLPAFVFVAISGPLIPRIRRSATASAFLDGVNVASLALMAVVTAHLAVDAVVDLPTLALAVISAVLLIRFKVASHWLILGGALAGLAWVYAT